MFLSPLLEQFQCQRGAGPLHDHRGYHLTPGEIRHSDDRNLGDVGVRQKRLFNLQRADLVASALDDIHGGATEDGVGSVTVDRSVAGLEPTVVSERLGGLLLFVPVTLE